MTDPILIDVLPVLEAVEILLRTTFAITFSLLICGGLAVLLCNLFGKDDEA